MDSTRINPAKTASGFLDAARVYGEEAIVRIEEDLVTPVDGYHQPEAARGFKGFLWNNELAERHPQNARTPAQGIQGFQGFQRQGGECGFIGDSEVEVPGVEF
jgi:hypothetical protein